VETAPSHAGAANAANGVERQRRKASFTDSPLAAPLTPIHRLAVAVQDYLYFPDPSPIYALMGALAANMMTGYPVWLMLIGPPACGKTELLKSLLGLDGLRDASSISGPAALLSGTKKREMAKGAKGGLLREIGPRGALVLKDFTSVLSLPQDKLRDLLSALREIYDGRWTRDVGTEGGRSLAWQGRIGLLTGSTETIDRHHQMIAEMGERFIFYRYTASTGWAESNRSLQNTDPEATDLSLKGLVHAFVEETGLEWKDQLHGRELDDVERNRLIAIGQLACRSRSAVVRDTFSKDIVSVPAAESPTRIVNVLGQLYRGMELIGVDSTDCWRIVEKIALDCMSANRREALLAAKLEPQTASGLSDRLHVSQVTARRTLEELEVHGVLERPVPGRWTLSEWSKERFRRGFCYMNGRLR
jgi:DNA-binding transcriptional ArsR family regulator